MIELSPWNYDWRQTTDTSEDADRAAENALFDCGNECYSAMIFHIAQVEISADTIKDTVRYDNYVGYMTCADMVRVGQMFMHVTPVWKNFPNDKAGWLALIKKEITAWRCMMGLFSWGYAGASAGHFRAVTGYSDTHIVTYDPMYGRQYQTHQQAWDWANGPQSNPLMIQPRRRCIAW